MASRAVLTVGFSVLLFAGLSACMQTRNAAESQPRGESAAIALGSAMLGDFATAPDNADATIIDRRMMFIVPGFEGVWLYSQLNTGDDLSLYRQRFHQLLPSDDGSQVIQRSYVPVDPERFVDAWEKGDAFAGLTIEDMRAALGEGCEQIWSQGEDGVWRGAVDPRTCSIFSERRQATIRIGAEGFYQGNVMGTTERGFDAEMNQIWGSAPGEFILLTRCKRYGCLDEARILAERPQ